MTEYLNVQLNPIDNLHSQGRTHNLCPPSLCAKLPNVSHFDGHKLQRPMDMPRLQ